jgi:hypothetical protein
MRNEILVELQQAKTLGDMLDIIYENYEVDKTVISPITKGTIISGLQMAVKMTGVKDKNRK